MVPLPHIPRPRRLMAAIVMLVCAGIGVVWFFTQNNEVNGVYTVATGDLAHEISFTGATEPKDEAALAFERPGIVARIYKDRGDVVRTGDVVAELDSAAASIALTEATARLAAARAALSEGARGSRPEAIAVARAKVRAGEQAATADEQALLTTISNSFTTADAAVRATADQLFDNPSGIARLKYHIADQDLRASLESGRYTMEQLLRTWRRDVESSSNTATQGTSSLSEGFVHLSSAITAVTSGRPSPESLRASLETTRGRLIEVRNFLSDASLASTYLRTTSSLSSAAAEALIADIALARENISAALASLDSASDNYEAGLTALSVARSDLSLLEAGTSSEELDSLRAAVEAESARVASAREELSRYVMRAPFSGTLVKRSVSRGDRVQAYEDAFTLEGGSGLVVAARVSELDVVSLTRGMEAMVTLDAYGDEEVFPAHITRLDQSETDDRGTRGYGVELTFKKDDVRVRPGMTANVVVRLVLAPHTLPIPASYVRRDNGTAYVQRVTDRGTIEEVTVSLGVTSPSGEVQVLEGVTVGDRIAPYDNQNR